MKSIKGFLNRFHHIMTAVSFAEAGEFDTAGDMVNKTGEDDNAPSENNAPFGSSFHYYRTILESNETAIEIITNMSSTQSPDHGCDPDHIRDSYSKLCLAMRTSLQHFDILTKYKYHSLRSIYNRIDIQIRTAMAAGITSNCAEYHVSSPSEEASPVLKYIAPLNLVDPIFDNFTPEGCRTMHDILRFMHVKAVYALTKRSAKNLHSVPRDLSPLLR